MGKKALSSRNNWQTQSGPGGLAGTAEKNLYIVFQRAFKGTIYEITDHPDHFKHLYENVILSPKTLAQIYCLMRLQWKPSENADGEYPQTFQSQIPVQEKSYLVK